MKRKAALHNLGCKVNAYELEAIQQMLEQQGYEIVPFAPGADIYIINTCTVTNIADRKSRQMLHKAKKMNPDAVVVACGCYVQAAGEKLEQDSAIDLVVGNNKKKEIPAILEEYDRTHHTLLRESLSVFLNHKCSILDTAKAMYVHRNTIKYRIARIQELTGISFEDEQELQYLCLSDWLL